MCPVSPLPDQLDADELLYEGIPPSLCTLLVGERGDATIHVTSVTSRVVVKERGLC